MRQSTGHVTARIPLGGALVAEYGSPHPASLRDFLGDEASHGVPDDDALTQCAQAVVHVLDVVEQGDAAEIADRTAAVMPAQVQGPGVPAGLGGRVEPGAEVPAAPLHAVHEEHGTGRGGPTAVACSRSRSPIRSMARRR